MEIKIEVGESFDEYFRELSGQDESLAKAAGELPAELPIGFFSQNDT